MLRIRNLDAGYGNLNVLRRVSLHVKQGEIVTIIGAITLLYGCIAGCAQDDLKRVLANSTVSQIGCCAALPSLAAPCGRKAASP